MCPSVTLREGGPVVLRDGEDGHEADLDRVLVGDG
jgi:hypothetical protein